MTMAEEPPTTNPDKNPPTPKMDTDLELSTKVEVSITYRVGEREGKSQVCREVVSRSLVSCLALVATGLPKLFWKIVEIDNFET